MAVLTLLPLGAFLTLATFSLLFSSSSLRTKALTLALLLMRWALLLLGWSWLLLVEVIGLIGRIGSLATDCGKLVRALVERSTMALKLLFYSFVNVGEGELVLEILSLHEYLHD